MKIAHVLTRFSPVNMGGVERVARSLAERQSTDHDVELICRNEYDDPEFEEKNGFKIKRAPVSNFSGLGTLSSLLSMRRLIKNSEADIFHIHDWSPFLNYTFAGSPGKAVLTLHNLAPSDVRRRLEGFAVNSADEVVCVSPWLSERIEARHNVETKTILNGVDLERFENNGDDGYALFVGRLEKVKGIEEVCEVFRDRDAELKVVGTGSLEENLKEEYDHDFLGYVSDERLAELYSRCSYLVAPSRKEGFGLVWAEAIASGKPVIATETGIGHGLPDYCGIKIGTGFEADELETAVEQIDRKDFDSDSIRSHSEDWHWEKIVEEYKAIYKGAF